MGAKGFAREILTFDWFGGGRGGAAGALLQKHTVYEEDANHEHVAYVHT